MWRIIANKTPYDIEIIFETDSENAIKKKEKEFIALYGRISNKTGTLANLSNGGEPLNIPQEIIDQRAADRKKNGNYVVSEETKQKIREKRALQTNSYSHYILQLDLNGNIINEFTSVMAAQKACGPGVRRALVSGKEYANSTWQYKDETRKTRNVEKLRGGNNGSKSQEARDRVSKWSQEYYKENEVWNKGVKASESTKQKMSEKAKARKSNRAMAVTQYSLSGEKIRDFESATEAERITKANRITIQHCCKRKLKTSAGFVWRYENDKF